MKGFEAIPHNDVL